MAILNYTTEIDSDRSISEVSKILREHGVHKITTDYFNAIPVGLNFTLMVNDNAMTFSLPCNYSGILKAMESDKKVPRNKLTQEQATRVGWRIIKDWVAAQMAMVDAEVASLAQVFLPYVITKSGETLYNEIANHPKDFLMLNQ